MTRIRSRNLRRARLLGLMMALPAIILLFIFVIWPVLVAGDYSFTSASGFGDREQVGWDNYSRALTDTKFYEAIGRNVIYAAIVIVLSPAIGFFLAYFLFIRVRGWRFLQVVFMVPYVTPAIVVALLWQFMLEPSNGMVNTALRALGLDFLAGEWLAGQSSSLVSVSIVQTWHILPLAMLLIFTGMLALDAEILEAADLDGAGHVQKMFSVVMPMMRPTIVLVVVLLTLQLFRSFDIVYLLTKGGPSDRRPSPPCMCTLRDSSTTNMATPML